jgi:hypothetical protein
MNMEENPSLWQDLEFSEICPPEHFSKLTRKGLKVTSNKKVININVVGNFKAYDLESTIVQNRVPMC